jgi:hypothetical protein
VDTAQSRNCPAGGGARLASRIAEVTQVGDNTARIAESDRVARLEWLVKQSHN